MTDWNDFKKSEKEEWLAVNVMKWEIRKVDENINGEFHRAYFLDGNLLGYIDCYDFNPTAYAEDALIIANKLGIALIPQSDEGKFRWYACDIKRVSYRGSEIAIEDKNDSGISEDTIENAICHAAYLSITNKE